MSSNNVRHLIIRTITTLQTLGYTSPHFIQLHFTALLDTSLFSFTLPYAFIWINPFTFLTYFHLTPLNQTQYTSPVCKFISKIMNPFTTLKETSPIHFTELHFLFLFFSVFLSNLHFTLLCFSYLHLTSLNFTSLHFLLLIVFSSPHWFSRS
jgi:hypothetical protein